MRDLEKKIIHLEYLVKHNPPKNLIHAFYRVMIKMSKLLVIIAFIYLVLFILSVQVGVLNEITPIPKADLDNFNNVVGLWADTLFWSSLITFVWIFISEISKGYKYSKFKKENELEEI